MLLPRVPEPLSSGPPEEFVPGADRKTPRGFSGKSNGSYELQSML